VPKLEDLTGQRFGRWTVLERAENKGKRTAWLCKCDCGTVKAVHATSLKNGDSTSCGCYAKEHPAHVVHGLGNTKLHARWAQIKRRCFNSHDKVYQHYGAKGITMCDEWKNDFVKFYDWSMANGYKDGLEIDRIDNSKGYSPDNCRWVTRLKQANNKTNNKYYTYKGETKTLAEFARQYGMTYMTLYLRVNRRHIPIDKAIEGGSKRWQAH